ncbi:MAG: FprA family A-type flavoprotein, partial [Clostridiales bacterium]|nr:FprA family A-type flavoprotein [Clostridiales bacterium]
MLEIRPNLYSVGVQDPGLRVFDIIMNTPNGSTYNAYLLVGSEKSALVETVKVGFCEAYFRQVEAI